MTEEDIEKIIEDRYKDKDDKTKEFIRKALRVHGDEDKYDYSKSKYINAKTKTTIICSIHGDFLQTPNDHLSGYGCPKCAGNIKSNTEEFIEKARKIHGDKFDYSKANYINNRTKVCIICPEHGEFWQTPHDHLAGKGCYKCGREIIIESRIKYHTTEEFIEEARKVHEDKYDYSKANYIDNKTKVTIVCNTCGCEFEQAPQCHLQGRGCSKCAGHIKLTTEDFIRKAREIHGNKYDYSKINYINNKTNVTIICPEHGDFSQTPSDHLNGRGCSNCKSSKLELECRNYLNDNNIVFEEQKMWDWLVYESNLRVDFYIPSLNLAIECQGEQHFESIDFFGGDDNYTLTIERDKTKNKLLNEHGIRILYFSNLGDDYSYPYKVFNSLEELLKDNTETTIIT